MSELDQRVAFVIGAPRSGTTILGDVLSAHPDVAYWHEPYFVWDLRLERLDDDVRSAAQATPEVRRFVRGEFERHLERSGRALLVEKTPRNCLKLPFVRAIFPGARLVHIHREPVDVIRSMRVQWTRRLQRGLMGLVADTVATLRRQPYWRNRLQILRIEGRTLQRAAPYLLAAAGRERGVAVWGPRHAGWKADRRRLSDVEFMAAQWAACERAIRRDLEAVPPEQVHHLRYRDLAHSPGPTLEKLLAFLGLRTPVADGWHRVLDPSRGGRGRSEFDETELQAIAAITGEEASHLGYREFAARAQGAG